MTTLTITNADWELLEDVEAGAVSVLEVTDGLIRAAADLGDGRFSNFFITGDWTGVSGLDLTGLMGTVTGIAMDIDGVTQFNATGLSIDVAEVGEDLLDDVHDVVELALGEEVDVIGSDDDDSISCTSGDDSVDGRDGDDDLYGELGDDHLSGGRGRDHLYGGAGMDSLEGGSNQDTLSGGAGDDSLEGGAGDDILACGSGSDSVSGGAGDDRVNGGSGHDELRGGAGDDSLAGGGGNDDLYAGDGLDTLSGGTGDDVYYVDADDDIVEVDDGGVDTQVCDFSETLEENVENLVLTGRGGWNGTGNASDNDLTGNSGGNALVGGHGDDVLDGRHGADRLVGGSGSDLLEGGRGHDVLAGGRGADDFHFDCLSDVDSDRIRDFSTLEDTITLESSVFTAFGGATGAVGADNFTANAGGVAQDADDFLVYETDTGKLFYDADGNGEGVAVEIALLGTAPGLSHAHFLLV
jgi:Ca2+-binding RTX toxin-like protein